MAINHTILGMLSYQPLTGYDLKKRMQGSSFMPWSGNNNQIYKALLELTKYDFVTSEVVHQDSFPSKKVYTITESGLVELKNWAKSKPEAFEAKKPFLLQLAWGDLLSYEELDVLLSQYEREIEIQLLMEQKRPATKQLGRSRSPRETVLWELINDNIILSYKADLEWIKNARIALSKLHDSESVE